MLMEWLEPMIKIKINQVLAEAETETKVSNDRLKQIMHNMIEKKPYESIQVMEIDELINEIITATVDFTYRRGFFDCSKLFKIDRI